ncbi:MAG: hypothetical protein IJX23_01085 [Clostridia bacterium]|nr:hypothetical protein [Clostridia bacterium]
MDYVIIKLYTNQIRSADLHDLSIEKLQKVVDSMKDFSLQHGKKLYLAPITCASEAGHPVDCTPFAEIEYTTALTDEEKLRYIEFCKELCIDGHMIYKKDDCYLEQFCTLTMVKFKKIDDEIREI